MCFVDKVDITLQDSDDFALSSLSTSPLYSMPLVIWCPPQDLIIQLPKLPRLKTWSVSLSCSLHLFEVPAAGTQCPDRLGTGRIMGQTVLWVQGGWTSHRGRSCGAVVCLRLHWPARTGCAFNCSPFTSASRIHKVGLFYSRRKAGERQKAQGGNLYWGDRRPPELGFATRLRQPGGQTDPNTCVLVAL